MAISFVAIEFVEGLQLNSDFDLPVPPTVQENDLLIAFICNAESETNSYSTPTGWTQIVTELQVGGTPASIPGTDVYYRIASDSEPSFYEWVGNNEKRVIACMVAYRGVSTLNPFDTTTVTATGSSGAPDCGSITTGADNARVLAYGFMDSISSASDAITAVPSGYTSRMNVGSDGLGTDTVAALADKVVSSSGAENPGAFTANFSRNWGAITIALRPETITSLGQSSETNSAISTTIDRAFDVGLPSEVNSVFVLATRIIVGLPLEVDFPIHPAVPLGIVTETSFSLSLYEQLITLGLPIENDTLFRLATRLRLGLPEEHVFSLDLFTPIEVNIVSENSIVLPLYRFLPNIDINSGIRQTIDNRFVETLFEDGYSQRITFLDPVRHIWRLGWDNITNAQEKILRDFFNEKAAVKPIAWVPFNHTSQRRFIARNYESQPSGFGVHSASVTLEEVFE